MASTFSPVRLVDLGRHDHFAIVFPASSATSAATSAGQAWFRLIRIDVARDDADRVMCGLICALPIPTRGGAVGVASDRSV